MKLIIDIPEQWRDDMVWENFDKVDELCQAILDGDVIPDNATNGDVIKAMFHDCDEIGVQYELTKNCNGWLDEPYQKRGCFRPTDDNSGTFCI